MKRYNHYMDGVKASDTLHQRLRELEAPEKRPVPWKKYGTLAAALVLVLGLGAYGWHRWDREVNPRGQAFLDRTLAFDPETAPDIALVEPGDIDLPGEKTLGGYEVVSGSGPAAIATYYVLPYIEYGETEGTAMCLDWDIPPGAARRDLTQEEIIALMGGEDAVNTHLDWGMYSLTGWAAWNEDGSFWGAYIDGFLPNYDGPTGQFEFAVTAGQLPPTCFAFPESVTQEIRGLTVTADKYDGVNASTRRVSFMKDGYGYRFDITGTSRTGTSRALTEEWVSRLVCRIADKGLALSTVDAAAPVETYICTICGNTFPAGTEHNDPAIFDGPVSTSPYVPEGLPTAVDPSYSTPASYTCADCGVTVPVGEKHYHTQGGTHTCEICGEAVPKGTEHSHELCGLPPAPVTHVCETCGQSYASGTAHNHTCEVCGQSYASGTAHNHTCGTCGESYPAGTAHSHTCEVCGQSYPAGTAHSHQEDHSSHHDDHHGSHH